jgi:hypothetical protein
MPVSPVSVVRVKITRGRDRKLKDGSTKKNFYFHPVAANNQETGKSEAYVSKANAKRAAERLFPGLPVEDETAQGTAVKK